MKEDIDMDVISRIEENYDKMSKGHKSIARFVLAHFEKAAFMNVSRLSEVAGVSEATVVRFSTELGYEKYQQFQKAVLEYAKTRLTSVQRMDIAYERMENEGILTSVLNSDIDKIRSTLAAIDEDEFNRAVEKIAKARRVYIIGLGSASALASFLGYYLNLIFDDVRIINSVGVSEIIDQLYRVSSDDVVIGISFPRYSNRTVNALKYAKSIGGTVVGVTDGAMSPIKETADFCLYARSDMESFVDSLVAPFSLMNALIVALGACKKETVYKNLEDLESIWKQYKVYETTKEEK
ncbi:MAG: MurR/RpiR family transcriptional regulator [Clostridia bacterium]|nr:MurR/RpiR family transcriptional regulator [Clostridia bacterium]